MTPSTPSRAARSGVTAVTDRRRNLFCRGYCACQGGARAETCRRASRCDACDPTMPVGVAMAGLGPLVAPPPPPPPLVPPPLGRSQLGH